MKSSISEMPNLEILTSRTPAFTKQAQIINCVRSREPQRKIDVTFLSCETKIGLSTEQKDHTQVPTVWWKGEEQF